MRDHAAMPPIQDLAKLSLFTIDTQKYQHILVWVNSAYGAYRLDTGVQPMMYRLLLDCLTGRLAKLHLTR